MRRGHREESRADRRVAWRVERVRVGHHPDTESVFVEPKPGIEAEAAGQPQRAFRHTPEGAVAATGMETEVGEPVDSGRLEVGMLDPYRERLPRWGGKVRCSRAK